MYEQIKKQNPELYNFLNRILGMDFFELCKESVLEDEQSVMKTLLNGLMLIDERCTDKCKQNYTDDERKAYGMLLSDDFPLELQLKLYDTVRLLSEAFRDEEEAELLNEDNLPMVIKAASIFVEYEAANGGDFFEYVCGFLEEEKDLSTMVEDMYAYFGLEYEEKCEGSNDMLIRLLKKDNEKYLTEAFFK